MFELEMQPLTVMTDNSQHEVLFKRSSRSPNNENKE